MDAIEISYREAGEVIFEPRRAVTSPSQRLRFSQRFECKLCNVHYAEPGAAPVLFQQSVRCRPRCQGFGNIIDFDLDLVIPDKSKSLNERAIDPWTKPKYRTLLTELKRFAKQAGIPLDVPGPSSTRSNAGWWSKAKASSPAYAELNYLERKKYKLHVRVFLSRYRGYSTCSACGGARLRIEAEQVRINGRNICQVTSMTVEEALEVFLRGQAHRTGVRHCGQIAAGN